jgi:DNA-binding CsgD family transcriptional regulator
MATDTAHEIPRYETQIGHWKGWCTTARGNNQLAPRQLRYMLHIANGRTATETASLEGVKPKTVAKSMAAIYHRLGLESGSATAAAALGQAIRKGIIAPLLILLSIMGPFMADEDLRRQKGGQRSAGGGKNTARMMVKTRPPTLY